MKITCERNEINEIVNTVQKAVSPKSTIPILECIKIDADPEGTVTFMGNNADICIVYKKEMDVEEGGNIALASKMFGEITRKLPQNDVNIEVNESNNITKIKCGESEFNIQGVIAGEFPEPPKMEEKYSFYISHEVLKNNIKKIISFIAVSEGKRPALTGALFDIKNDKLTVVASDGHRLAVVNNDLGENIENNKFIIPGSSLRELFKLLKDDDTKIKVVVADRYVLFEFGNFKFYSRLLDGDFLKYEAFISVVNKINVTVETSVLKESLERALLLINEDTGSVENKVPVKLNIGFNKIEISSMTGKGKVNDTVNASIEGDNLIIGFNCRFLLDALNVCDDENIRIELSSPTGGCFIKSVNNDNGYLFMILPVRLYN